MRGTRTSYRTFASRARSLASAWVCLATGRTGRSVRAAERCKPGSLTPPMPTDGCFLSHRAETNWDLYEDKATVLDILEGRVEPPECVSVLHDALRLKDKQVKQ